MKRIIMFQGDIETQGYFSLQMADALKKLGHEVFVYDLENPWKASSDMLRFFERGNTVVLSFNFHGMCQEVQFIDDERNTYIWDDLQIPCYNILADHPYYYYKLLAQRPRLYTQLSIDLGHEAFMKRFFPEVKMGPFLPLAGTQLVNAARDGHETGAFFRTPANMPALSGSLPGFALTSGTAAPAHSDTRPGPDAPAHIVSPAQTGIPKRAGHLLPIADRSMDVVFTGNYAAPSRFEKYITRIDDEYTSFYYGIIDDLLDNPVQTVEDVVEKHLKREITDITEEDLKVTMQSITFIDLYVRYHVRGRIVKALTDNGIKVNVFGDRWNELRCEHPENLIDGDSIYSVECLEKIADSKISLNVLPWFRRGPHDRIYNTFLQKTVCVTDSNPWLDTYLKDKEITFSVLYGIFSVFIIQIPFYNRNFAAQISTN